MKMNQVYALLNDINHQMYGEDAVTVNDLQGIISMGNTIVGDGTATDNFLGKLVDRIGKTVIRTLDLELDFPSLFMDTFEFGAVLQKINVNPFDSITNAAETIGDNGFTPTLLDIHKPQVWCRYFTDADTAKWQVTIPDTMFRTAFESETQMSSFIDAIIAAMTDSVTISLNNMSRTAVNNFIAEKIKASNGVINLLTSYNTLFSQSLTPEVAMRTKEFLRYATNEIRKYMKYISQPSVLYNLGDGSGNPVVRATTRDNAHILCLTDFVAGCTAYLESDTFHNELTKLPEADEVAYWQGSGLAYDFGSTSAINVKTSGGHTVSQAGILCTIFDREALGVSNLSKRVTTQWNAKGEFWNNWYKHDAGYFNDFNENGVVFHLGEYTPTPAPEPPVSTTIVGGRASATKKALKDGTPLHVSK